VSGKDNVWKTITLVLVAMLVATAMMTLVFYGQLATSEERYRSTVASLSAISGRTWKMRKKALLRLMMS